MNGTHRFLFTAAILAGAFLLTFRPTPTRAYVEAPMSLGAIVAQSSNIVLMRVEKVDREKNLIFYRKVRDIKGQHPQESIKHNIGRGGLRPNEWKPQMDWAEPGKMAVFFHNGGASETCIGTWWYQAYGGGEWWNHSHAEPFLLRSFAGNPEKLAAIAADMVAGKETVAPCMVDGNKEDLHLRRAKIQRLKVSLKLQDYNPKRDFVGWGGEDFRRLTGMPGFTHYSAISRVDPEAQAISAADFDGDGKTDLCLVGAGRVTLLQNGGESLNEASLPESVGARAAVWADYNGDGKADLLLATALGPKLYTNQGGGSFKDNSYLLPQSGLGGATAAAWLDADGDGRPDVLLAHGYHGLRLHRNLGKETAPAAPAKQGKWFEDVSAKAGLGSGGIGGGLKGDTLTVCDVNGDGRPDVLYGAGKGILLLNARGPDGAALFAAAKDSGIAYQTGKAGPVFGDYDHDGHADLFVPQKGQCKLFKGDGKGKFTDVTARAGALAQQVGWAACAAWADLDNDGHLDLIVGCLRGPNRFFRNKGDGTFADATESVGLHQRVFNTQAVALADLNSDGALDLVLNNEGQESAVLLGNPDGAGKRVPVTVQVSGKGGVVGSRVQITDKAGKPVRVQEISGGNGRGGQPAPVAHFALEPGAYRVLVRYSSGVTRGREITVASSPLRSLIDDQAPQVD
jgi:hypothetical protein